MTSIADIDECAADTSPCEANADCTNNEGSFTCACKTGFSGTDGVGCTGKLFVSCVTSSLYIII